MKIRLLSLLSLLALSIAASAPLSADSPPPGGMKLLPGYVYKQEQGIDSFVGEIAKPGGLTLQFDIGMMSGDQAANFKTQGSCLWYKDQQINGQRVEAALDKRGQICVTVSALAGLNGKRNGPANFYGKVTSQEDIADTLLMVLTYSLSPQKPPVLRPSERLPRRPTVTARHNPRKSI